MVKGRTFVHDRFARCGPEWRTWIVILAVALIGAASTSTMWHGEHGVDQDCAVCQLRHQPAADLSAALQVGPAESPEPFVLPPAMAWVPIHHGSQIPARAPPA